MPVKLPTPPEGWEWGPQSNDISKGYLTTQHILLQGPETTHTWPWGGPPEKRRPKYSAHLKKHSACCGIGHATYLQFPPEIEKDKLSIFIEAILEIMNRAVGRALNLTTLSEFYDTSRPLIEVLVERGWTRGPTFENQVWRVGDPNNKVSIWWKDGAPTGGSA
jgi:hypothetical protein